MTTSTRPGHVGLATTLLLALAACSTNGSSTTSSAIVITTVAPGTPLGSLQQNVYDLTRSSALAQGVTLDERCMTNIVAQLSDDDAQQIVAATPRGDTPTLSALGTSLVKAVPSCVAPAASTTTTIG